MMKLKLTARGYACNVVLVAIVSLVAITLVISLIMFDKSSSKHHISANISRKNVINRNEGLTANKSQGSGQQQQQLPVVLMSREYYPAGSSLPDCSHACGPCFPCKRVMVSFKCSVSESCPVVYKCTCKGKFYHIPSSH